ncbi:MAG: cysteine desulfurase family protein [Cyanobacteria bacterium P01_D01_bin.36]
MQIYLDYSATTPPRSEVLAAMQTTMQQHWGNPSSLHYWGNRAATALERSRQQIASLINAPNASDIVFTAGGTEANNLAVLGIAQRFATPQHIITSSVEHSAIANPIRQLEAKDWQVTWLPADSRGMVNPIDLKAALQPNTILISIIYGQSEVGTLQPIAELGAIARASGVLFHTDAVQVAGRLPIDVQQLNVDLLSVSSHKIYGPQGAGALYIRHGSSRPSPSADLTSAPPSAADAVLSPILHGGNQEQGLRSGTQALPNIVGFGLAAELATAEMPTETLRLIHLRDRLFSLMADTHRLTPTGDPRQRLPHHVSFCLPHTGITGKHLVRQMNLAGIGISAGSACHSGKLNPSPILTAMGYSEEDATSGIRLTLGKHTTEADIDWSAMVLKQVLERAFVKAVAV